MNESIKNKLIIFVRIFLKIRLKLKSKKKNLRTKNLIILALGGHPFGRIESGFFEIIRSTRQNHITIGWNSYSECMFVIVVSM